MSDTKKPKSDYLLRRRRRMNAARFKARKEAGKLPPKKDEVTAALSFLESLHEGDPQK